MEEVKDAIQELEALKSNHSLDALTASSGTEFQYGKACGVHQGLSIAIERLKSKLEESPSKTSTFEKNLRGRKNGSVINS